MKFPHLRFFIVETCNPLHADPRSKQRQRSKKGVSAGHGRDTSWRLSQLKVTGGFGVRRSIDAEHLLGQQKGPQLREKKLRPRCRRVRIDSERMNAACRGVRVFTRHHSVLHHSRDSLRARFIPTFSLRTEGADPDPANGQINCSVALSKRAKPRRNKTICGPVS
jgi:hypothetical protein